MWLQIPAVEDLLNLIAKLSRLHYFTRFQVLFFSLEEPHLVHSPTIFPCLELCVTSQGADSYNCAFFFFVLNVLFPGKNRMGQTIDL